MGYSYAHTNMTANEICVLEYDNFASDHMRIRMPGKVEKFPVLAANIRTLMKRLNWDQAELAHQIGVSQGTVSRWGVISEPRGVALGRLAELAGVRPVDFVETDIRQCKPTPPVSALPSGAKAREAVAVWLDAAGLGHLADDYAEPLARRLPGLLAALQSPTGVVGSENKPLPDEPAQDPSTPRRGKRPQ